MKTRVLSGLIMLPLLLIVFFGGKVLLIGCLLVGLAGVHEFYNGFRRMGIRPTGIVAAISGLGLYAIHLFTVQPQWYMVWFSTVIFLSLITLFRVDKRRLEDAMATIVGIFYIIFFSYHVVLVDQIASHAILVWLIFLTAFGTDIMAYFTGMLLGRHKLCPKISPKKTVEGSVGGILGSVLLCSGFGAIFAPDLLGHCVLIGILGGIVSQVGDLTASIFKRKMEIKDYGNLIPGHGGILDRFDSVLFTSPMVYYYIVLVIAG